MGYHCGFWFWKEEKRHSQLTKTGRQCLYRHGAMAAFHIDGTSDMNKKWRHIELIPLSLQQGISLQDAEGVLVLVDCVGVGQGLIFTLCMWAGAWTLFILHHQICVTLCRYRDVQQVFCTQNTKFRVSLTLSAMGQLGKTVIVFINRILLRMALSYICTLP